jgi:hydrogenase maturation protease
MRIIACGNLQRNDDAAAIIVAQRLRSLGIEVTIVCGEALSLIESWSGEDEIIVVDTIVSGSSPGTVRIWDSAQAVPLGVSPASTHGLGLLEAVELARAVGRLPKRLQIFGIEGDDFGFGTKISTELLPAIEDVVELILARVRSAVTRVPAAICTTT